MTYFNPSFTAEAEVGPIKVNKTTRRGSGKGHLWLTSDIKVWVPVIGKIQHVVCTSILFGGNEKIKTLEEAIEKGKGRVVSELSEIGIVLPESHPVVHSVEWEDVWTGVWAEYPTEMIYGDNK